MADPAAFDWSAFLASCAALTVQTATWVAVSRWLVRGMGMVGR